MTPGSAVPHEFNVLREKASLGKIRDKCVIRSP